MKPAHHQITGRFAEDKILIETFPLTTFYVVIIDKLRNKNHIVYLLGFSVWTIISERNSDSIASSKTNLFYHHCDNRDSKKRNIRMLYYEEEFERRHLVIL